MNLLEILKPECIKVPMENITSKRDVIDQLVNLLGKVHNLSNTDKIADTVWAREMTRTTGIGQGLAIPHSKSDECDKLLLAIGKPDTPVDFDSIDKKPVKLIFLLISPPDRTSDHIQTLARISRLMIIQDFRDSIYAAETAQEVYELFKKYETSEAAK